MLQLTHSMAKTALAGLKNNNTVKAYKSHLKDFDSWAKAEGVRSEKYVPSDNDKKALCQKYSCYLQEHYTSAATVHTYLAPVCKGLGINMREIDKPIRTAGNIIRGRVSSARSDKEQVSRKFERIVTFQRVTGCRRADLSKLAKDSIVKSDDGYWYVDIRKSKGGKDTMQRILPHDNEIVQKILDTATGEKLFSKEELNNKINFHSMRAEQSKRAYAYYAERLNTPEDTKSLYDEIINRFKTMHSGYLNAGTDDKRQRILNRFIMQLNGGTYRLRGENLEIAKKNGNPTEYDRVAVMTVSVFHLSHWRLGVTVTNYLNK